MNARTVRVIHRFNGGWSINILPVTVNWVCPQCGQERGEPHNYNFCEDGEWYSCDQWENSCGHIDKYVSVIAEAASLMMNWDAAVTAEEQRIERMAPQDNTPGHVKR